MPNLKNFSRFSLRLPVLVITGLILTISSYSQFQQKAKYYNEAVPKTFKSSPADISIDDETQLPHTLVGGYYDTRNGLTARLLLNNKAPQSIEVLPILYSALGEVLQIPPITIERASYQIVDLKDWANIGGEKFQQGSIRLFHRGKPLVLGTQVQITDESKSLVFESKLSELGKFNSRRLEGVWAIPNNTTDSTIVLTNTSDEYLTVTATLTRKPDVSGNAHTFNLLPHEVKVLSVKDDFNQGQVFAKSEVLGLSLAHEEKEDALLAWTMIKDESKGYSNVATFTNPARVKSNRYHGAGLQLGSIGNDALEPIVILRNTSDIKVDVNIKVLYTKNDGTRGTVTVNTIKLNPREVHQANMQSAASLNNVKTAGIEIEYTESPGSVIATAQSVSKSGNQVFRTLLWDPPALKSAASLYPFSIEGTSSTKAFIKNAGFKDEMYVSHLTWGTDGEYVIPVSSIKKGETIEIDVKKLRNEQIPDERGRKIPLNVSQGQIHWSLRRSESTVEESLANKVPLVGQAMEIDTAKGMNYTYFCLSCCDYGANSFATLLPSNLQLQHPSGFQYQVRENGKDCYGNRIDRYTTSQAYDWRSSAASVATVNEGYVTTQAAGQTEITAKIRLPIHYYYGFGNCGGGGGVAFAKAKEFGEICNEGILPVVVKNTPTVSFSNISFKSEPKHNAALLPDECDCISVNREQGLHSNLTVIAGTPVVNSLVATIASTSNAVTGQAPSPGNYSTTNNSLDYAAEGSTDLMVVFQSSTEQITVQAQGSSLNSVKWKVERDSGSDLPTLSSQTGSQIQLTPTTSGNFRLICYYDLNNNGVYDSGEELRVLLFAIVRFSINEADCTIRTLGATFTGQHLPVNQDRVDSMGAMGLDCEVLIEGGGTEKRVGVNKVTLGNVGNLIIENTTINYPARRIRDSPPENVPGTAVEYGGSPGNDTLPMVDTGLVETGQEPTGGGTAFRSSSSQTPPTNGAGGGQKRTVIADDNPDIGLWDSIHPTTGNPWNTTSGGHTFREYIVAFSDTFPRHYVVLGKQDWAINFVGQRSGDTWVDTGSSVYVRGNQTLASFTLTVNNGSPQSGNEAGVQVLGLSYANEYEYRYFPMQ